ncbi:MAG: CinA family protein [Rhizobiaceae bacterium]
MTGFPADILQSALHLIGLCRKSGLLIATAESCTGGLIIGALTEIAGSSDVIDCGFVTYSNAAKTTMLHVPARLIKAHGAVSRAVVEAMVEGTLKHSNASLAVAVTGIAGPGGGSAEKPVGLVYVAAATKNEIRHVECRFGDIGRGPVRQETIRTALKLMIELADQAGK